MVESIEVVFMHTLPCECERPQRGGNSVGRSGETTRNRLGLSSAAAVGGQPAGLHLGQNRKKGSINCHRPKHLGTEEQQRKAPSKQIERFSQDAKTRDQKHLFE